MLRDTDERISFCDEENVRITSSLQPGFGKVWERALRFVMDIRAGEKCHELMSISSKEGAEVHSDFDYI